MHFAPFLKNQLDQFSPVAPLFAIPFDDSGPSSHTSLALGRNFPPTNTLQDFLIPLADMYLDPALRILFMCSLPSSNHCLRLQRFRSHLPVRGSPPPHPLFLTASITFFLCSRSPLANSLAYREDFPFPSPPSPLQKGIPRRIFALHCPRTVFFGDPCLHKCCIHVLYRKLRPDLPI